MTLTTLPRSNLSGTITGHLCDDNGPPLLLIHGVGMNADYWGNLMPALSPQYQLKLVDMPGHGNSQPLTGLAPSLTDFTDAIADVISQPLIVAGHSMGALIALDLAVRYAERVNGIAVLNGIYRRSEAATQSILQRVDQLNDSAPADPGPTLCLLYTSPSPRDS